MLKSSGPRTETGGTQQVHVQCNKPAESGARAHLLLATWQVMFEPSQCSSSDTNVKRSWIRMLSLTLSKAFDIHVSSR